jgi:hypothetical protein
MKAAVAAIKDAMSSKDLGAFLNHYLIADGELVATDGKLTAGYPIDYSVSALVPGPEFEALVGSLEGEIVATELDGAIELRAGRMHGTIKTLPPDTVAFLRPEGEFSAPPEGFVEALRRTRNFIADQAVNMWGLCACLRTNAILASNNISLVEVECRGLATERDILIPRPAVDFITGAKAELEGYLTNENHAGFRWSDGLWLRTQLVDDVFPANASKLLEVKSTTPTAISREWKKAYSAVADISEAIVSIHPDKIVGGKGKAVVEYEVATEGLDQTIHLNPKFLDIVMGVAKSWNPQIYPKPIPFRGDGVYGIVVGRQK